MQLRVSVVSEVDAGTVSVATGIGVEVTTPVGVEEGLVVNVGTSDGNEVLVGEPVGRITCSLLCTLVGFITSARIQPAVTRMIARMASGNHNCLILFTIKLAKPAKFRFDIHFYMMTSIDFPQPLRKYYPIADYTINQRIGKLLLN